MGYLARPVFITAHKDGNKCFHAFLGKAAALWEINGLRRRTSKAQYASRIYGDRNYVAVFVAPEIIEGSTWKFEKV